jgi:uncharacterized membrane protein
VPKIIFGSKKAKELQTVKYTMKNIIIFTLVLDASIFSLTLKMEAIGSPKRAYFHTASSPTKQDKCRY